MWARFVPSAELLFKQSRIFQLEYPAREIQKAIAHSITPGSSFNYLGKAWRGKVRASICVQVDASSDGNMVGFLKLLRSFFGLTTLLSRELGLAASCALRGNKDDSREHLRVALQGLHEDLASLAGRRAYGSPLPAPETVSKILIVKLDRVGDMVNTTPVFDYLQERYPDAKLDIVGHPAVLSLLDGDPRIADRFSYTSPLYHAGAINFPRVSAWKLIKTLHRKNYPVVIYLRGSFPFLLLALRSHFLSSKFVEGEPVIRRYLKPLGAPCAPNDPLPLPSLHVSRTSCEIVLSKYPNFATGQNVVIHAVSAAEGKQWPLERFARTADAIAAQSSASVLFLATPSERDKLLEIQSLCRRPHRFETDFRLPEVVAAISLADVFIGNDSGLAHIAAAVRTREVIIWGAANLEMARPIAVAEHCVVLYHDVACRQSCPEIRCVSTDYLRCLRDIHEVDVVAQVLSYLIAAQGTQTVATV